MLTVAGCHSATPREQMQAAQSDLISEEMALQRCETQNGYASEKCGSERSAYGHDLAASGRNTGGSRAGLLSERGANRCV
jgi:hypothetical protein